MKYIQIITIITLFTFYSCGSDVKIDPKTDSIANENYKDSIRTLNNNLQYDNLKQKYNAYEIENDSLGYTFQLDDYLSKTKRPIIIKGLIVDVYKSNTNYIVLLSYVLFKGEIISAKISIDESNFGALKNELDNPNGDDYQYATFIVNECKFKTSIPKLVAENKSDEDTDAILSYNYRSMIKIVEGKILDFSFDK